MIIFMICLRKLSMIHSTDPSERIQYFLYSEVTYVYEINLNIFYGQTPTVEETSRGQETQHVCVWCCRS